MKKKVSELVKKSEVKSTTRKTRQRVVCPVEGKMKEEYLGDMGIMELMERIAGLSNDGGAPKRAILEPEVTMFSEELGKRLIISPMQAFLLSLFVNCYPDSEIQTGQLAYHLHCMNLAILSCYDDIKVLIDKKYIREKKSGEGIEYSIPTRVITAFRENHDLVPKDYSNLSGDDLFEEIYHVFFERHYNTVTYAELVETLTAIISSNQQLTFCRQINDYQLDKDDWTLLVAACHYFYMNQNSTVDLDDIRDIFPRRECMRISGQLRHNDHPLLKQGLLEPAGGELVSESHWCLSHKTAQELMGEICPIISKGGRQDVIKADSIGTKKLFYPASTTHQISELEDLLKPQKFAHVQESLAAHGMRKGFACLFYGAPGTGKTETVLQIARSTGRDIMQVDMSQLRDMFVGESEKNVKQIFTKYRRLCRESDLTPILLLNEADALLSTRIKNIKHSTDQMENAMQNIVLQEMENFEGILVATTNLTQNLDEAFDRRFLYKVEFQKPTAEESRHIWQAMLPRLSDENARSLASKYNFSGGQIENIARKQVVNSILHANEELDMSLIRSACDQEHLNRDENEHTRITGFC